MPSLQQLFHGKHDADKMEWRPYVFSSRPIAVVYRLSPLGYSVAGMLCVLYADRLRRYDTGFWWCVLGLALVAQGDVAYCSDVISWGQHHSVCRVIDPRWPAFYFASWTWPWHTRGVRTLRGARDHHQYLARLRVGMFLQVDGCSSSYRPTCCVEGCCSGTSDGICCW